MDVQSPEPNPRKDKPGTSPTRWVQAAKYSQAALTLPASVLAGILIGAALDRWLHRNWITVVGLIVGAIAGFVELIRIILRASASDNDT